jgi:hypothetical protein
MAATRPRAQTRAAARRRKAAPPAPRPARRIETLTYGFCWNQLGYLGLLDVSLTLWRIEDDDPMEEWESLYDDNWDSIDWEMVHPEVETRIRYLMKRYALHAYRGLKEIYPDARIKIVESAEHGNSWLTIEPDDLLEDEDAAEFVMELIQEKGLEDKWIDAAWEDMNKKFDPLP